MLDTGGDSVATHCRPTASREPSRSSTATRRADPSDLEDALLRFRAFRMFDRERMLVHADLGRGDATLLEPTLDRLQRLHEFPIELGELYLNLSVSLKRDLLAPEEARQVNDEETSRSADPLSQPGQAASDLPPFCQSVESLC